MSLRSSEHEKILAAIEAEQPPEDPNRACDQSTTEGWPDPAPLNDQLLPVQSFEIRASPLKLSSACSGCF